MEIAYDPVDLTTVKPANKIHSEKDLESEIAKICDILRDTCKAFIISTIVIF